MANKKINQLVAKTTILSTDLFPLGNPTTGQLFKKTIGELQAAIGGAVISVNGLVGTVVLDTDDIQELASPTNRYFTDARARGAISLTVTGNSGASTYNSSTGVLNVPTYTLAGLGGITASFLSGASGIAYNSSTGVITYTGTVYTDASIRALFSAGTGISYNSSTGAISYSGTVYTDASIRALISLTTTGTSGASTYNNTTGVLNVPTYTLAGLGGISLTSLSGSAPITYNSSTGAIGITQASGAANGFLSSTDWTTFNSKQSALTLGNVTESVSNVLMFPDGGTNKTVGNLSIQVVQAGSTTNGYLSTTDWNTFNNKQGAITLTTTGTSGAATFSAGTLNIPQYQAVLTNPVTGTGTTNYVTKWTSSSAVGNSQIFDNGTSVGIGTTTPKALFETGGVAGRHIAINSEIAPLISNNAYFSSGWKYRYTGAASYMNFDTGATIFASASSGSADATISWTERMRITQAGNVGIGTSSPESTLEVRSGTGSNLRVRANGSNNLLLQNFNTADGYRNIQIAGSTIQIFAGTEGGDSAGEKMRITAGGEMIVGTTSQAYTSAQGYVAGFKSANANQTYISIAASSQTLGSGGVIIGIDPTGANIIVNQNLPFLLYTNATERLRCTAGGNLLLGTATDNGERLYVSGSIRATGSITANSDARLKKNIERIENALEKVGQISGYTYNTIYDEDRHAGVIAQEVDKVLPEIVNKGNDGLMGVEYGNISALLIEAIKEQKVLIESLQAKVEALSK